MFKFHNFSEFQNVISDGSPHTCHFVHSQHKLIFWTIYEGFFIYSITLVSSQFTANPDQDLLLEIIRNNNSLKNCSWILEGICWGVFEIKGNNSSLKKYNGILQSSFRTSVVQGRNGRYIKILKPPISRLCWFVRASILN